MAQRVDPLASIEANYLLLRELGPSRDSRRGVKLILYCEVRGHNGKC